ncbi:hypothetical protein PtA15_10A410 [Puccinia triticina]|uniref:tRNA (guanine(10)-N(2))-methyltransferase n=1 Tax=Puccinia triticina TaxID=208348 RepID=A0ABY7CX16_9BASI|nr:uncharacterized protein PtA15_10A410 [Puccinia triticina]WAQ88987.1 hypothetical protein PtA15_10A410 [Puccinia triticina]
MAPQIYILIFAQAYEEFRLPELESIDVLFNLGIDYLGLELDIYRPYMKIGLENDQKARLLGSRAILIKHILRHWADAPSYPELHRLNKANKALWAGYAASHTFKVTVNSYKATVVQERKREIIESLSYMDFQGPIILQDPQVEIMLSEEHYSANGPDDNSAAIGVEQVLRMTDIRLRTIWLGEKICDGQRSLVDKFDLKKRIYIGNTSMEAGLSLLMANQGLVRPASLVNDPFTGTGSMLYASAWYGGYVFGSDIDGRPMRGKEHSIQDSAKQYGVSQKLLDCAVFDMTQNPWRTGEIFDAIICDPPYGVRAGAKRLGRKDQSKIRTEPYKLPDGTWSHEKPDYVPPSKPWEMSEVLEGLLEFALQMLKPNGRLVYWLPTASQDYNHSDVPQRKGLRLVANSCQDFGKWQRRVSTLIDTKDFPLDIHLHIACQKVADSLHICNVCSLRTKKVDYNGKKRNSAG